MHEIIEKRAARRRRLNRRRHLAFAVLLLENDVLCERNDLGAGMFDLFDTR